MTKLLYCESCQDIVSMEPVANKPKKCRCGRHSAWWANPYTGEFRVLDHRQGSPGATYAAFVIGLHNEFLRDPSTVTSKQFVDGAIARTPSNYIFKSAGSLIIKFRPGYSSDTAWASELPGG